MLAERPLPGAYDLGHLQAFHASIFGDIYPQAGELRTVNIAKRTPFCPARNLNWSGTDPQRNEDASVKSFLGENSLLERVLDELLTTTG